MAEVLEKLEEKAFDAQGKRLGRIATDIAQVLLGKDRADQVRNSVPPVHVSVKNASKLLISEKKMQQKEYVRYSGYMGGQKKARMRHVVDTKGYAEILRRAVYGMLPNNRLRAVRMKRLNISE